MKVADGASNVLAQARAAEEAGATALLVHRPSAGDWQPGIGYGAAPLPVLALRADEAAVLTGALGKGKAEVSWRATAVSPYVYNLSFPETRPVTSDRTCKVRDRKLGSVVSSHESMGVAADFVDTLLVSRPHGGTFGASNLDVVAAPGKRTEYCTAGDIVWQKMLSSSFPWGELMAGNARTYQAGRTTTEAWYRGLLGHLEVPQRAEAGGSVPAASAALPALRRPGRRDEDRPREGGPARRPHRHRARRSHPRQDHRRHGLLLVRRRRDLARGGHGPAGRDVDGDRRPRGRGGPDGHPAHRTHGRRRQLLGADGERRLCRALTR
ncbi:hypothetical protein ABZ763_32165 [Streptomyces bacillaris]|uniref:hypothetical protein n=1 Tax=Streptomyces bacillaris TaxID=68179 RepID=UPI003461786F